MFENENFYPQTDEPYPYRPNLPAEPLAEDNMLAQPSMSQPSMATSPYAPPYGAASYQAQGPAPAYVYQKPKQGVSVGAFVFFIILCLILSAGLGLGGSYFMYNLLSEGDAPGPGNPPNPGTVVLYRSVETQYNDGTPTGALSVADIADLVADSVVEIAITIESQNPWGMYNTTTGAGSGVIISTDGYILTCYHVIEDATQIAVKLRNGDIYAAVVIGSDKESDLAIIKIDATVLTAAVFGDVSKLRVGETAVAIGNPLGSLGGSVSAGIISSLSRDITIENQTMELMQIDAAINPGNSGGGLFDSRGNLVGIVNAKNTGLDVEGLGFAIPLNNENRQVIEDLFQYGYVRNRVQLGVALIDIFDSRTARYYGVSEYGVYINQVEKNSNAARAGLQAADILLEINGISIDGAADVKPIIKSFSVGDTITIKYKRSGQERTTQVTLQETTNNIRTSY